MVVGALVGRVMAYDGSGNGHLGGYSLFGR